MAARPRDEWVRWVRKREKEREREIETDWGRRNIVDIDNQDGSSWLWISLSFCLFVCLMCVCVSVCVVLEFRRYWWYLSGWCVFDLGMHTFRNDTRNTRSHEGAVYSLMRAGWRVMRALSALSFSTHPVFKKYTAHSPFPLLSLSHFKEQTQIHPPSVFFKTRVSEL